MDWRLRRAEPADAAACSLIAGATFLEAFAGILDGADIVAHVADKSGAANFAAWAADAASVVTLAEAPTGGAPLGYSLLTTPDLPVPAEDGDIELKRIYALAPTHGTGLGAALMQRAIDDARALGRKRMLLGVYGGNARAQRFYAKQGFAVAGTRRFKVGATWHDDLVFARAI
ncbi:GNAT family N-acetyltransferase [Sphingomonas lycopersici]|uniref:GNAT family N-acetyltransferase n=1 Tax=Sphingomonas lycopersici TaxID=2951807 RepID=A0AA41ZKU4_9SPHN|nr:GNAT family N-acetyltransferase [Sphingomonas lycopersici]MCW6529451.1 GNAT family N-acetyltransferase [Sphingomonas lycopersici]MCW6537763.1 GNAT family N-acetyltransferase [Sphingomonas lycopersici]